MITKYRLELNPSSHTPGSAEPVYRQSVGEGWCFKGNYGSPEAAWRKAQTYLERGKTSRLWNGTTFRVFQVGANGGYGAMTQVRFRNSDAERGVVIAEKVSGEKVGAWLE